jgi:hypothetical protein
MKQIITDGHGYLKITPRQLKAALDKGFVPTHYSFINKNTVLLEEDIDEGNFLKIMGLLDKKIPVVHQHDINRNHYNNLCEELCNYVQHHMFAKNVIGV